MKELSSSGMAIILSSSFSPFTIFASAPRHCSSLPTFSLKPQVRSFVMDQEQYAAALAGCTRCQLAWVSARLLVGDVDSVLLFVKSLLMPLTESEKATLVSNMIRFPSSTTRRL